MRSLPRLLGTVEAAVEFIRVEQVTGIVFVQGRGGLIAGEWLRGVEIDGMEIIAARLGRR